MQPTIVSQGQFLHTDAGAFAGLLRHQPRDPLRDEVPHRHIHRIRRHPGDMELGSQEEAAGDRIRVPLGRGEDRHLRDGVHAAGLLQGDGGLHIFVPRRPAQPAGLCLLQLQEEASLWVSSGHQAQERGAPPHPQAPRARILLDRLAPGGRRRPSAPQGGPPSPGPRSDADDLEAGLLEPLCTGHAAQLHALAGLDAHAAPRASHGAAVRPREPRPPRRLRLDPPQRARHRPAGRVAGRARRRAPAARAGVGPRGRHDRALCHPQREHHRVHQPRLSLRRVPPRAGGGDGRGRGRGEGRRACGSGCAGCGQGVVEGTGGRRGPGRWPGEGQ